MLTSTFIYFSVGFLLKDKQSVDCLLVALSIPSFLLVIWTGSISYQLTPLIISQNLEGKLNINFINALIIRLSIVIVVLSFFLWIFQSSITALLVPGFSIDKLQNTQKLIKYTILLTPIQLINSTLNSFFITLKWNILAGTVYLIGNTLTIVLLILVQNNLTPYTIIVCIALGNLLTLFGFSIIYCKKFHQKHISTYRVTFNFKGIFREFFFIILILIVSRSMGLIQNSFASSMKSGTITILTYTNYIVNALITILITPILNISYARQCEDWNANNKEKVFIFFRKSILLIITGSFLSMGFLFLAIDFLNEIILLLNIKLSYLVNVDFFKILLPYCSCLVISALIGRLFYIAGYFKTINFIDLICVIFYALFTIFLSKSYGLIGFFLSSLMYSLVLMILYFIVLKKSINFSISTIFYKSHTPFLVKITTILILSIVLSYYLSSTLIKFIIGAVLFSIGFVRTYAFYKLLNKQDITN